MSKKERKLRKRIKRAKRKLVKEFLEGLRREARPFSFYEGRNQATPTERFYNG